jgi:hypothetical protein
MSWLCENSLECRIYSTYMWLILAITTICRRSSDLVEFSNSLVILQETHRYFGRCV